MIEDSNKSGTYIEFSFEKSLRRYQNPPCKKSRQNAFINNQHSSTCQHCINRISRRDSMQSEDRKLKIQSCRKNEFMKSRCKARQFSQTKKRKQQSNSQNKSRQSSIKRQTENSLKKKQVSILINDPLSEFNIGQQLNLRHLKREDILNLSLNKDVPRFDDFDGMQGTKKRKLNQIGNQLTIQKVLRQNNLPQSVKKQKQMECSIRKRLENFCFNSIENVSRIIQEQDESFSQLSLAQSNMVLHSQILNNHQKSVPQQNIDKVEEIVQQQEECYHFPQNPAISYAYFSSCTSIKSFQSQVEADKMQSQRKVQRNQNYCLRNMSQNELSQETNPFQNLRLQSKEELKKQCRNQQRQRVFYKIKKISQADKAYNQCQNISTQLKNELQIEMKNQDDIFGKQQQKQAQNMIDEKNNYKDTNEKENNLNQNIPLIFKGYQSKTENKILNEKQDSKQNKLLYKRQTPGPISMDKPENKDFKKKSRRINFEIDQDYQRLGRVKIQGLSGKQNESICLSVRRLSKQAQSLSKDLGLIGSLDQNKVISYLLAQRPYLENNKVELQKLLKMIMSGNKNYEKQAFQKLQIN